MHSNYAADYLAIFQKHPKSYSGQPTCHVSTIARFLPHHHPITASLAARLQIEIPLHGKDDCHASLCINIVRVGSC